MKIEDNQHIVFNMALGHKTMMLNSDFKMIK